MLQKDDLKLEITAFSVAVAAGALGAISATAGAHIFGGLLIALAGLALFVIVIPGIAAKLGPSAQAIPAVTLFVLGCWAMVGVGQFDFLGVLALLVGIATALMPFVLIQIGGRKIAPEYASSSK